VEGTVTQRRSKYNVAVQKREKPTAFGIVFDSVGERDRYLFLRGAQERGVIADLAVHPRFKLLPAQRSGGKTFKGCSYTADFAYIVVDTDEHVVEDFKSRATMTKDFMLRVKMLLHFYPALTFRVVTTPGERVR
jgi:hypothetical protein